MTRTPVFRASAFRASIASFPLLALGGSMLALASGNAWAQDTSQPTAKPADANDMVGTGSRIRRKDADSLGPLLSITSKDIVKSGSSSVGDLLQKLPSAQGSASIRTARRERPTAPVRSICAIWAGPRAAATACWCWSMATAESMA